MSADTVRGEFETWAAEHYLLQEFGPERNPHQSDEYCDPEVQVAWESWQASRAALVVELPRPHYEFDGDPDPEMFAREVVAAIARAGITVKE